MTSNQIKYWSLEETKRSNRANERETNRSNVAREVETNRHNVITEQETERHNRATELLSASQVQEAQRHNMAVELQTDRAQAETERANLERENNARNQVALGYANVGLGYSQLAEAARHNRESENLNLLSLAETQRNNVYKMNLEQDKLEETIRSNQAREDQNRLDWITSLGQAKDNAREQQRHNVTTEQETQRSNKVSESWKGLDVLSRTVESGTRSAGNISELIQ